MSWLGFERQRWFLRQKTTHSTSSLIEWLDSGIYWMNTTTSSWVIHWMVIYSMCTLSNWGRGLVSQKSRSFSGAPIPSMSWQRRDSKPSNWAMLLVFSYINNMLKDQLFKTSGLLLDNWLLGREKFSVFEKQATGPQRNSSGNRVVRKIPSWVE